MRPHGKCPPVQSERTSVLSNETLLFGAKDINILFWAERVVPVPNILDRNIGQ